MLFRTLLICLVIASKEVIGEWSRGKNIFDKYNTVIDAGKSWGQSEKSSFEKGSYSHMSFIGSIPPARDGAKVARFIVRNSGWGSLASISTVAGIESFPFADVYSFSDGPSFNSTGVPYFYVTPLDLTAKNIEKDPRCSLSLTLAQGHYCEENNFDPEDPRCAHVVLTGKIVKVKQGTDEEIFAKNAMFSRHPAMKIWPKDYFGGVKMVSVDDYFHSGV